MKKDQQKRSIKYINRKLHYVNKMEDESLVYEYKKKLTKRGVVPTKLQLSNIQKCIRNPTSGFGVGMSKSDNSKLKRQVAKSISLTQDTQYEQNS